MEICLHNLINNERGDFWVAGEQRDSNIPKSKQSKNATKITTKAKFYYYFFALYL